MLVAHSSLAGGLVGERLCSLPVAVLETQLEQEETPAFLLPNSTFLLLQGISSTGYPNNPAPTTAER